MTDLRPNDAGADPSVGFTWLERGADGLLVCLTFGFLISALAVYVLHGGLFRNGILLACLWSLTGLVGYFTGERLGRGFAGGLFLWRWLRAALLVVCVIAFCGGAWIGIFRAAEPTRPAATKSA